MFEDLKKIISPYVTTEKKIPYDYQERKKQYEDLSGRYPNHIPIIVNRESTEKDLKMLDKTQFLAPNNMLLGTFKHIIQSRLDLRSRDSIWFSLDSGFLFSNDKTMAEIYKKHKNVDGFLYLYYHRENVFG